MRLRLLTNLFTSRRGVAAPSDERPGAPDVDAIVNQVLDREVRWSRDLDALFKRDRAAADRLRRTQEILDQLRAPARVPDLSSSILTEVGARRGWMTAGWMRFVTAGRLAAAACFVLVIAGAYLTERMSEGRIDLAGRPTPLTDFVSASRADVSGGVRDFVSAVECAVQPPQTAACRPDVAVPAEWPSATRCELARSSRVPRHVVSLQELCAEKGIVATRYTVRALDPADRPVLLTPVIAFEARRVSSDQFVFVRSPQSEAAVLFGVPPR